MKWGFTNMRFPAAPTAQMLSAKSLWWGKKHVCNNTNEASAIRIVPNIFGVCISICTRISKYSDPSIVIVSVLKKWYEPVHPYRMDGR